jgi:hypothetical protein
MEVLTLTTACQWDARLADAVITVDALQTQSGTAQVSLGRRGLRDDEGQHAGPRAWPSAFCAWTATTTSPPPTAITAETHSER